MEAFDPIRDTLACMVAKGLMTQEQADRYASLAIILQSSGVEDPLAVALKMPEIEEE